MDATPDARKVGTRRRPNENSLTNAITSKDLTLKPIKVALLSSAGESQKAKACTTTRRWSHTSGVVPGVVQSHETISQISHDAPDSGSSTILSSISNSSTDVNLSKSNFSHLVSQTFPENFPSLCEAKTCETTDHKSKKLDKHINRRNLDKNNESRLRNNEMYAQGSPEGEPHTAQTQPEDSTSEHATKSLSLERVLLAGSTKKIGISVSVHGRTVSATGSVKQSGSAWRTTPLELSDKTTSVDAKKIYTKMDETSYPDLRAAAEQVHTEALKEKERLKKGHSEPRKEVDKQIRVGLQYISMINSESENHRTATEDNSRITEGEKMESGILDSTDYSYCVAPYPLTSRSPSKPDYLPEGFTGFLGPGSMLTSPPKPPDEPYPLELRNIRDESTLDMGYVHIPVANISSREQYSPINENFTDETRACRDISRFKAEECRRLEDIREQEQVDRAHKKIEIDQRLNRYASGSFDSASGNVQSPYMQTPDLQSQPSYSHDTAIVSPTNQSGISSQSNLNQKIPFQNSAAHLSEGDTFLIRQNRANATTKQDSIHLDSSGQESGIEKMYDKRNKDKGGIVDLEWRRPLTAVHVNQIVPEQLNADLTQPLLESSGEVAGDCSDNGPKTVSRMRPKFKFSSLISQHMKERLEDEETRFKILHGTDKSEKTEVKIESACDAATAVEPDAHFEESESSVLNYSSKCGYVEMPLKTFAHSTSAFSASHGHSSLQNRSSTIISSNRKRDVNQQYNQKSSTDSIGPPLLPHPCTANSSDLILDSTFPSLKSNSLHGNFLYGTAAESADAEFVKNGSACTIKKVCTTEIDNMAKVDLQEKQEEPSTGSTNLGETFNVVSTGYRPPMIREELSSKACSTHGKNGMQNVDELSNEASLGSNQRRSNFLVEIGPVGNSNIFRNRQRLKSERNENSDWKKSSRKSRGKTLGPIQAKQNANSSQSSLKQAARPKSSNDDALLSQPNLNIHGENSPDMLKSPYVLVYRQRRSSAGGTDNVERHNKSELISKDGSNLTSNSHSRLRRSNISTTSDISTQDESSGRIVPTPKSNVSLNPDDFGSDTSAPVTSHSCNAQSKSHQNQGFNSQRLSKDSSCSILSQPSPFYEYSSVPDSSRGSGFDSNEATDRIKVNNFYERVQNVSNIRTETGSAPDPSGKQSYSSTSGDYPVSSSHTGHSQYSLWANFSQSNAPRIAPEIAAIWDRDHHFSDSSAYNPPKPISAITLLPSLTPSFPSLQPQLSATEIQNHYAQSSGPYSQVQAYSSISAFPRPQNNLFPSASTNYSSDSKNLSEATLHTMRHSIGRIGVSHTQNGAASQSSQPSVLSIQLQQALNGGSGLDHSADERPTVTTSQGSSAIAPSCTPSSTELRSPSAAYLYSNSRCTNGSHVNTSTPYGVIGISNSSNVKEL